ncbi:MAG: PAN domain-containing protein [Caldimonas sp.]
MTTSTFPWRFSMWHATKSMVLLALAISLGPDARGQAPAPYRFEAANYWGSHYQTIANATDPQDCAIRCDADARCRVASFSGPRAPRPWANTCVLRSAVGPRHTEQPDIRSWVKGATASAPVPPSGALYRFERANYWSNNYLTIKNARDPQACAQRCDGDPKCRVASFSGPGAPPPWANTCVLRHAIGPRHTNQPDIVSWVKP